MTKLAKVVISPDGDAWKIEILDEAGNACYLRHEEIFNDAMEYGYRQGTLYQLEVDVKY